MSAAWEAAEQSDRSLNGDSPITRMQEDGTLTFQGSYQDAVARLFAYECSGTQPENAGTGRTRNGWERYTCRATGDGIFPRRGLERILGRLWVYESFGLSPPEWVRWYGNLSKAK